LVLPPWRDLGQASLPPRERIQETASVAEANDQSHPLPPLPRLPGPTRCRPPQCELTGRLAKLSIAVVSSSRESQLGLIGARRVVRGTNEEILGVRIEQRLVMHSPALFLTERGISLRDIENAGLGVAIVRLCNHNESLPPEAVHGGA